MTNPAGEQVEGNVSDIDLDAKFFTLEDRTGKVFIKIYWKPAHEEKMRKQKAGYYEAPLVTMEGKTGGLQEAVLVDLPYKDRGDFPRIQKKGGNSGGGRPFTPRNEKPMIYESAFKSCVDLVRPDDFKGMDYAARAEAVRIEAEKIAKWMITNGGA